MFCGLCVLSGLRKQQRFRGVNNALCPYAAVRPAKSGVALKLATALQNAVALAGALGLLAGCGTTSPSLHGVPFVLGILLFLLDESQFLSSICVLNIYPCATSLFLPSFLPSLFMCRGTLVIRLMGRL